MSNQCFITRRGGGSFTKSVIIATGPAGSAVKCQQLLRSANLVKSAEYPEASAQDASCVTLKQCDSVAKGDRVQVTLDVTASAETKGYWAPESGLISEKREITLKSGKQTIKLDVVSAGALSLETKFFCKSGSDEATITAENLQIKKITPGKEKIVSEKNGTWTYRNIDIGLWAIQASLEDQESTNEIEVPEFGVYRVNFSYQLYPDNFIFSGENGVDYEIVQDDDTPISVEDYRKYKNWKARILTSITITPKIDGIIDVFLVGGGGGGYTATHKNIAISANTQYQITIGAGGLGGSAGTNAGKTGGQTNSFGFSANGGGGGGGATGNSDGNGGAAGKGGSNGGSGGNYANQGTIKPGTDGTPGQSTTTREFAELSGYIYCGGGGGGRGWNGYTGSGSNQIGGINGGGNGGANGQVNTGGGGGGGASNGTSNTAGNQGGSGIVVIRNARELE